MPNDTQENIETLQNKEEENTSDYAFLHEDQKNNSEENFSDKFDLAFNQSSPAIQNYILSDKFEENIRLICKIEKLDDEKANIIIENVAVSILVGILPITEAKNTLMESFKASGVLLEDFSAGLIMKNIDAYILSDIRKQILQSKSDTNKEIRHLTLKESNEEKEKEELRKILLERTGNLNGKGEILVGYKNRESNKQNITEKQEEKSELNRDSLLAKLNLKNVSDTDKIKERMAQIKKEEEERIAETERKKQEEKALREERDKENQSQTAAKENKEYKNIDIQPDKENEEISKIFAETLKEKIENGEKENQDLDLLKQEREKEEAYRQAKNPTYYAKEMKNVKENSNSLQESTSVEEAFDPYRETI
ncbi:MAG: hypothetical protein U0469_02675 [Candidatus Paceibacterota bacterium]